MTSVYGNWPEVFGNFIKARKSWARLTRILGWWGDNPRVLGVFFKTVVHEVLLFGSYMWVLNPCMVRDLGSFQRGVARRITGIHTKIQE